MCAHFPTCEPLDIVLQRVAAEIGAAADGLEQVETHVVALIEDASRAAAGDIEQLQSLDRLGQQLRALEAFLRSMRACSCGRIDVDAALDQVWLEGVRRRLGGGRMAEPVLAEPELW